MSIRYLYEFKKKIGGGFSSVQFFLVINIYIYVYYVILNSYRKYLQIVFSKKIFFNYLGCVFIFNSIDQWFKSFTNPRPLKKVNNRK